MTKEAFETTDPSRELATVAQHFRDATAGGNTFVAIAQAIEIDPSDPTYLELLGTIHRRVRELQSFAANLHDPEFDQELRAQVTSATSDFAKLFSSQQLQAPWERRAQHLTDKHITTLRWFSTIARRYRVLRVVPAASRDEVIKKIDEAIQFLNDEPLADWMKAPLHDGLRRLKSILQHLLFFGHEIAIDELLLLNRKIDALSEVVRNKSFHEKEQARSSFLTTLTVISLAANLFLLPDQAVTAYDRYQGWAIKFLTANPQIPNQQRLLPAPEAVLPKDIDIDKETGGGPK